MRPFFLVFSILVSSGAFAAELKVVSDRTESHLKPLFEAFEKKTGTKVLPVFMDKGLLNRLESRPTEADVVITKDADLLEIAKTKKLLQAFSSSGIATDVSAEFRDRDATYFVDAYRARVIFYSKARVKPEELSTYEDLASPKWKGRLCIRSGYHDYNIALFGQFLAHYGSEKARAVVKGLHANLAREPKGNDREQAKGIFEGKCDVALMNTYYHPIMATTPEQKPWADATGVFFPDQQGAGAFIMRSGLALTNAKGNVKAATELLEFFASKEGQEIMTRTTFQYPVNGMVPFHEATRGLGEGQGEVKEGRFRTHFVPLAAIAQRRESVVKLLDETQFDKTP